MPDVLRPSRLARSQRWQRHDAHRFTKPEPIQRKSYSERLVEQRQAAEEAASAAEQEAFERAVLRLRRELATLKLEYELRCFQQKYHPDQPRVPKGNPDGGQWTKEGGGDAGKEGGGRALVTEDAAMRRGPPDKRPPLPLHAPTGRPTAPGERIAIINNAQTGLSTIDETSSQLLKTLEGVVNDVPAGSGPRYGTKIHTEFAEAVRKQNITGIGRAGVEQTFPGSARYGADDSIRTDVVLRDAGGEPIAIYDVKTGGAYLSTARVGELRAKVRAGAGVYVIEMHVLRGLSLKSFAEPMGDQWRIIMRLWHPSLPSIADMAGGGAAF